LLTVTGPRLTGSIPVGGRAGSRSRGARGGFLAETATGFFLGATLALVFLTAAGVFLGLAAFGGLTLFRFRGFAGGPAGGFLGLGLPVRILTTASVGEGMGTGITLLVGKRPQHHAGTRGISGRTLWTLALTLRGRTRGSRLLGSRLLFTGRCCSGHNRTALHRLDHDRLGAAMGEALTHRTLFDRPLQ
jgi:hypothetical protein